MIVKDGYITWNIRLLRNRVYPVVITSGARLAKFDEREECLNWVFVASKHGAVASPRSTGLCWIAHGEDVTEYYLGNLHLRFLEEFQKSEHLGDAWKNAITSYIKSFNWSGFVERAFHMKAAEEFILFGDPTLLIHSPRKNSSHIQKIHIGRDRIGKTNTIQSIVDNAPAGDEIFIPLGVYIENVTINKPLSIIGINSTLIGH